jgi:hypothetical protein
LWDFTHLLIEKPSRVEFDGFQFIQTVPEDGHSVCENGG